MKKRRLRAIHSAVAFGFVLVAPASAQMGGSPLDNLARADSNRDGQITMQEMRSQRRSMFDRLDVDGNLRLSSSDVQRWTFVMGREGAQEQWRQFRSILDANQDNIISRGEFVDGRAPAFDAADANNDDVVSAQELAAARAGATQTN